MEPHVPPDSRAREPTPEAKIFELGEVLNDAYEIRGLLGAGANGQVFDAHDRLLNRRVAIKAAPTDPPLLAQLLRKEAQALAALRHPALVNVFAMGTHRGVLYFVMEHIPGITLEDHLQRRTATGEQLSLQETLDVLIAIAEGLAAVHRAGIAHRDVKPGNVMLAPGNRIVLTDLGLVVPEFDVGGRELKGTPEYMAPEVILGQIKPGAAHLVDTYALGVLAFELVTGSVPYDAESISKLLRLHLQAPIPEVAGAPKKLAALIQEMMDKDPLGRPQQLETVVWRLRALRSAPAGSEVPQGFAVLVVDDDRDIAKLIKVFVRAAVPKAEVAVASSAKQALEMIRSKPPQLMIMDLMMPGMNGIELCMYLRAEQLADHCTIAAVSAAASPGDIELLYELGVSRFIDKGPELRPRVSEIAKEVYALLSTDDASKPPSKAPA
jgi:eukaryotic-like serine/threonine-protein kinase